MRTFTFYYKPIFHLIVFAILLQSCAVYKKNPSTMDEAVAAKTKVLIIRSDDVKLHLKRIVKIDSNYFGQKNFNGQIQNVPLSNLDIKTIRILDKSSSTLGNIGIVVGSILVIGTIIVAASLENGWEFEDTGY